MAYKLQKQTLRKTFGSRCMLCERPLQKKKCTFHHRIPKSSGGTNDISNGAILCSQCQSIVHRFGYGTSAYKNLDTKIENNLKKYKKGRI